MAIKLDKIDRQLILLLQENSRLPAVRLAAQLGISQASVHRRMKRLYAEKVIEPGVVTDPFKVGFGTYVFIWMQIQHGTLEDVARQLAQMDELFIVAITTGRFDVMCAGVFCSNEDLANFVLTQLQTISGIERVETVHVFRFVKRTFRMGVPRE